MGSRERVIGMNLAVIPFAISVKLNMTCIDV